MKICMGVAVALCARGLISPSAYAGASEHMLKPVDYLKLTRASVPNARSLVDASYINLDFNLASFKERIKRVEQSAWLPESVNFGYGYFGDSISDYGFYGRNTTSTNFGASATTFSDTEQTQYGTFPNRYSGRQTFTASMRWDLQNLFGVNSEEINTLADVINQIDQEGFALGQIAKSYGQLMAALPESPTPSISESQAFVIFEHAAILDSLSGGLISQVLRAGAGAGVVVLGNGDALQEEMQKTKEDLQPEDSRVIEVRDGQDYGVEIIGGASN